ncbi:MAG: formate dehydrogenase accessory sulfurtransferase FdhD [Desulfuromonadales bacterium]
MDGNNHLQLLRYEKGRLRPAERRVVREFPLRLTVNGRELATLIGSPHQLNFLTAGFLRLQGFVETRDDLLALGVCADFGVAKVRIRGDIPARLTPTLTSGCGAGLTFGLPEAPRLAAETHKTCFSPESILQLAQELARRAEQYRSHGGIHSAAVGDGRRLLLYAEDVGRHNTLDRIAGEAMLRDLDLRGTMLVTSGRISSEMVAKAARLGIALLASRTSATDVAVRMAEQAGITLISYLRGESFEICAHPQRLLPAGTPEKIRGITGVILAGGESRRMGSDKSLLPLQGARFIDLVYRTMAEVFEEVLIVTNSPGLYPDLPCRKVPDIYYAQGSLAGLHSGLCHAGGERIFAVACDMPMVRAELVRHLCGLAANAEVIIPHGDSGHEPLHAVYHKNCIVPMEAALDAGRRRIVSFFPAVRVQAVGIEEMAPFDPQGLSFRNINTPEEYFALRERGIKEPPAETGPATAGQQSH